MLNNIADSKRRERLVTASVRLPEEVRAWAKAIAQAQTTKEVSVNESDVYRHIIMAFYSKDRLQNVDG